MITTVGDYVVYFPRWLDDAGMTMERISADGALDDRLLTGLRVCDVPASEPGSTEAIPAAVVASEWGRWALSVLCALA